jgi:hypothetical protein
MKKPAFALMALSMSAAASAQVYGSLGLGVGNWSGNDAFCVEVSVCDREDTSYRAVLGYRFNSWIAIEGGYIGFGKMKTFAAYLDTAQNRETERYTSLDAAGPALGVAFFVPLAGDKVQLRGRLGLVSMQTKASVTDTVFSTVTNAVVSNVNRTGTTSSLQPYAGIGVSYRLTSYMTLDGSLDVSRAKYGSVGLNDKARLAALNAGLTFEF